MAALRETTIPFILTLFLAAFGWLFDKALGRFDNSLFVNYSTAAEGSNWTLTVANESARGSIEQLGVQAVCSNHSACLLPLDSNSAPLIFSQVQSLEPLFVQASPIATENSSSSGYSMNLPAGAAARLSFRVADPNNVPRVIFAAGINQPKDLVVSKNGSFLAYVSAHYYAILAILLAVLMVVTVAYFVYLLFPKRERSNDEPKDNRNRMVLILLSGDSPDGARS